jgi:CHAD domain-containing protein
MVDILLGAQGVDHTEKVTIGQRRIHLATYTYNKLKKGLPMDIEQNAYTSKLKFNLDPQMRSDEAARTILQFLCGVMRHNEEGIRQDSDAEHLHDYRVAVRRTRSALGQIKGVFPQETTLRYKEDFALVGRWTNDLRDMDVYLSAEESYRSMLPQALQDDIGPLFDLLRQKRGEAQIIVVEGLDSEEYAALMAKWEAFLAEPSTDDPTAPNAGLPIVDLACARIYKRYRRVVKTGRRLLEGATDDELHALRVECKKLRYLMEFFASLFPRKKIKYLIKQLKRLQRNLGNFNDFRIQQAHLFSVAADWPHEDAKSGQVLLAIGSLIGTLEIKKVAERSVFDRTFIDFASPANNALFKELFSSGAGART